MATKDPRPLEKTEQKLERPYAELCYAVVAQACKDYRHALRIRRRIPKPKGKATHGQDSYGAYANADDTIRECEHFFRYDVDLWCDLDGEWLIRQIRENVK